MTFGEWDQFCTEKFVEKFAGQSHDFYSWLRRYDLVYPECDRAFMERLFRDWSRSVGRGKNAGIVDRKRLRTFTPGRFWARSSSGVFLNKHFVKGWRGINPVNP